MRDQHADGDAQAGGAWGTRYVTFCSVTFGKFVFKLPYLRPTKATHHSWINNVGEFPQFLFSKLVSVREWFIPDRFPAIYRQFFCRYVVSSLPYFAPWISANSSSNCSTFVPPKRLITPESTTSVSSRNSSSPILFPSGSGLFQTGFPPSIASFS